jgi:hypothetical protein
MFWNRDLSWAWDTTIAAQCTFMRDFTCSVIANNYHLVFWCHGTSVWHEHGTPGRNLICSTTATIHTMSAYWEKKNWYLISYLNYTFLPAPATNTCLLPFSQCLFTYGLLTLQKISRCVGRRFRFDGIRENLPIIMSMTRSPRHKIYLSRLLIPPCQ